MSSSSGDVNEVFPHKVCINLDRDRDSWERLQAALTRHDILVVRRVSAVDGSRLELPATWRHSAGAYGCLLSHLQVVRDARKRGLPSLLILEDDVAFDPSFSEKFPVFVRGLPADWDMVFLGALHRDDPDPVAENVVPFGDDGYVKYVAADGTAADIDELGTMFSAIGSFDGTSPASNDKLVVTAATAETAGTSFNVTITAQNSSGATDTGYLPLAGLSQELRTLNLMFSPIDMVKVLGPNTAAWMDMSKDLGTLEPGKLADIVLLNGNPLDGYWNFLTTTVVIKGGQIVVDKR